MTDQPRPRILIGALSGADHQARRLACLQTWMAHLPRHPNIADAVFLMAQPYETLWESPTRIGSRLYLPCPDAYPTLPQRTRWFCTWAMQRNDWDYLFKCDDDTYVALDRLAEYDFPPGVDYIGAEWKRGVNYGSGGAGYFLSRRAARVVAMDLTQPTGAEDLLVGKIMQAGGYGFHIDPRFIPWGDETRERRRPTRRNDLITSHKISPEAFVAIHRDLYGEEPRTIHPLADTAPAAESVPTSAVQPGG